MSNNSYSLKQLKQIEKIVVRDSVNNIDKIILPNNVQVGAGSNLPSTLNVGGEIKGYIHELSDGTSYLIAGENIDIVSGSSDGGSITIAVKEDIIATAFSGSLTHLNDGTSYLIAGTNVTITTGSNGSITIASSGGGGGSGAVSSVANGADNRVVTFSAADSLNGEANLTFDGSTLTLSGDASLDGSIVINEAGADKDFRVESDTKQGAILVDAGLDAVIINDNVTNGSALKADTNVSIGGTIDSRGTSTRGTSVFSGDVAMSGSLWQLNKPGFVFCDKHFWLGSSPTNISGKTSTAEFHLEWNDGGVTNSDPEALGTGHYWKYFPFGGEVVSVFANGSGAGNFAADNTFIQDMVFSMYFWDDDFVTGTTGVDSPKIVQPIGRMTASSGNVYGIQSTTYKHKATYNFSNVTASNGSFVIPPDTIATFTIKGEGTQRRGFEYLNVNVVCKMGLK
jgi:hypothetical protein